MQFGLFMMPSHPPHRSIADSYDRDLDIIMTADRLGYNEAWIGEHITEQWENAPSPELLIAKALALTERITLATGVTLLCLHNPIELAHRIAMLDHLARGRFYWGIGTRAIPTDLELFGLDPDKGAEVRERSLEVLDIVLKIWESEGKFDYHGKYFDISAPELDPVKERGLYIKPYQSPHPPIGVASTSIASDSSRDVGARGWIPMSSSLLSSVHLKGQWQMVEEGAASAGKIADRSEWRIARDLFVAETPELARQQAEQVLVHSYIRHEIPNRQPSLLAASKIDPEMPDSAVDVDYMMEHIWIVGDPQQCADRIRNLYEDVGGFGTLLAIPQDPDDHQWEQRCLELLMNEVGPRISDLN